jgi:hypothetical protein
MSFFIKYIALFILGYFLYKIIKPYLIGTFKNDHIKGDNKDQDISKKYASRIEDAKFEELE